MKPDEQPDHNESSNDFTDLGMGLYRAKTYAALLQLSQSLAYAYADFCIISAIYLNYSRLTCDDSNAREFENKLMTTIRAIQKYERLIEPPPWYCNFSPEELLLINAEITKRIQEIENMGTTRTRHTDK